MSDALGALSTRFEPAELAAASALGTPWPAGRAWPRTRRWETVVLWLLLAVVLLAPLPLGSNRPLPASALCAAVGVLLCVWAVGSLVAPSRAPASLRPFWPSLVMFGLVAAWAAVQAMPFTPASLHHPYWSEARRVLELPYAGAISVNPGATCSHLMGLLAYGGIFWLALQLCRSRARAHKALLTLAAGGLLYAGYGLFDALRFDTGVVTSTFVNRNSYATYAGMTLFCAFGLILHEVTREGRACISLRRIALDVLSRFEPPLAIGIITCLVAGTAMLLTQSRGGFVALCAALVAFVWALRRMALVTSRALVNASAVFSIGVVVGLVALAGEATLGRFPQADAQSLNRIAYYRTTWQAIGDRPLLGTGYGTYADAFKPYNHPGTGTYFLDKAHNTYLQMIMELGWPAAAALLSSVGLLVLGCLRERSRHGRSAVPTAVLAACSALVAVHSLVDFSLEMPANAATYALILGLVCAQSPRGRARRGAP